MQFAISMSAIKSQENKLIFLVQFIWYDDQIKEDRCHSKKSKLKILVEFIKGERWRGLLVIWRAVEATALRVETHIEVGRFLSLSVWFCNCFVLCIFN